MGSDSFMEIDKWKDYVTSFGFGNYLGYDHPTGKKGFIPSSNYYNRWYNNSWRASTTISNSIGQGEVLTTPIQLANFAAIIANKGWYIQPHFVKNIDNDSIDKNYTHSIIPVSDILVETFAIIGLINIYSSTYFDNMSFFSLKTPFGKQLIFALISLFIFLFILVSDDRFFFRYSSIIYLLGIILLIAVLIFGNEIKGAKSWFSLMGFSLQPSEFMKPITALALAKYLSNVHSDLKRKSIQFYSVYFKY